jgi:hypothetical protein
VAARAAVPARHCQVASERGGLDFTFGRNVNRAEVAVAANGAALPLIERAEGRGRLLWCPVPAELADEEDQTVALYRHAAARAGLTPAAWPPGVLVRPVRWGRATLLILVNETDRAAALKLGPAALAVTLPAQRSALVLLGEAGERLAAYLPEP